MPVVVNRTLITDADINSESARVQSGEISGRHEEAARRLVIRELLRLRAKKYGIDFDADPDAAIEAVLDREVQLPDVDEQACRRYFDSNPERFCTPVTAEVRHILLKAAPDNPEERARAEQRAGDLLARTGGNEFGILVSLRRGIQDALAAAARIQLHCPKI